MKSLYNSLKNVMIIGGIINKSRLLIEWINENIGNVYLYIRDLMGTIIFPNLMLALIFIFSVIIIPLTIGGIAKFYPIFMIDKVFESMYESSSFKDLVEFHIVCLFGAANLLNTLGTIVTSWRNYKIQINNHNDVKYCNLINLANTLSEESNLSNSLLKEKINNFRSTLFECQTTAGLRLINPGETYLRSLDDFYINKKVNQSFSFDKIIEAKHEFFKAINHCRYYAAEPFTRDYKYEIYKPQFILLMEEQLTILRKNAYMLALINEAKQDNDISELHYWIATFLIDFNKTFKTLYYEIDHFNNIKIFFKYFSGYLNQNNNTINSPLIKKDIISFLEELGIDEIFNTKELSEIKKKLAYRRTIIMKDLIET